jgi:homoaconitase/3-isopropylmalate dehydratase large subunit
MVFVREFYGM